MLIRRLACAVAAAVPGTEPGLGGSSAELQAAAVCLSLAGGAGSPPGEPCCNRLPADASGFPEAAPGRLLRRAPSLLAIGELWKGVIFTLGL